MSSVAQGIEEYAHLCRKAIVAPAQSAPWIRHWTDKTKPDAFIATLRLHGSPVLALALEVQQWGPFRIARFMGGRHANGNFAAASPAWLDGVSCAAVGLLFAVTWRMMLPLLKQRDPVAVVVLVAVFVAIGVLRWPLPEVLLVAVPASFAAAWLARKRVAP